MSKPPLYYGPKFNIKQLVENYNVVRIIFFIIYIIITIIFINLYL